MANIVDIELVADGKYVKTKDSRIIAVPRHALGDIRPEEWAKLFAVAPEMLRFLIEWDNGDISRSHAEWVGTMLDDVVGPLRGLK